MSEDKPLVPHISSCSEQRKLYSVEILLSGISDSRHIGYLKSPCPEDETERLNVKCPRGWEA